MSVELKIELKKLVKGAVVAAVGAFLTYVVEKLPGVHLGEFAPVVAASLAVLVNVVRKTPVLLAASGK